MLPSPLLSTYLAKTNSRNALLISRAAAWRARSTCMDSLNKSANVALQGLPRKLPLRPVCEACPSLLHLQQATQPTLHCSRSPCQDHRGGLRFRLLSPNRDLPLPHQLCQEVTHAAVRKVITRQSSIDSRLRCHLILSEVTTRLYLRQARTLQTPPSRPRPPNSLPQVTLHRDH